MVLLLSGCGNALAKGIDLNAVNQDGWAPLHLAGVANQVAAVEWLLKNGVRTNAETAGSRSALDIALTPGFMENEGQRNVREEIVKLLRQHGGQRGSACCGKTGYPFSFQPSGGQRPIPISFITSPSNSPSTLSPSCMPAEVSLVLPPMNCMPSGPNEKPRPSFNTPPD